MGIPIDATKPAASLSTMKAWPTTSPPTTVNATLPTPAQSPSPQTKKWKGFPTPTADSYGDLFDLDAPRPEGAPPPYTGPELELALALDLFPVETTVWHGTHILRGKLYHLPSLFSQLYERLMDISPSDYPQLGDEDCKPWAVMHPYHSMSWVHEKLLYVSGTNTTQLENQEPRFVAVTDSMEVWKRTASMELPLGNITVHGVFSARTNPNASNDIIVALPCNKPLLGHRSAPLMVDREVMVRPVLTPDWLLRSIRIKDILPAPTTPDVLDAVSKVLSAVDNVENLTNGNPKKTWLVRTLPGHFGDSPPSKPSPAPPLLRPATSTSPSPANTSPLPAPTKPQKSSGPSPGHGQRMTLNQSSPLWPHRGNEALLKRSVWQQMCYPSGTNDSNVEGKGGVKVPDAYSQVLFENLQARKRVPGTEELAGVASKWYLPEEATFSGGSWGRLSVGVKIERNGEWDGYVGASPGGVEGLLDVVSKAGSEEDAGERMEVD